MCTSHWSESLKCPVIPATKPLPSPELRFAATPSGWAWGILSFWFCSLPPSPIRTPRHKTKVKFLTLQRAEEDC